MNDRPAEFQRLAARPLHDQIAALEGFIRSDPDLMAILMLLRAEALPDCWLVSGAIYQSLWNHICGLPRRTGIKDYDVIYFDGSDLSYDAEDRVIQRLDAGGQRLGLALEVRNQARVHVWFAQKFGFAVAPLSSSLESLLRYASTTHAVAARLDGNGVMEIAAPYGLGDIFGLHLRPNRLLPNGPSHNAKAQRFQAIWPKLTVEWCE